MNVLYLVTWYDDLKKSNRAGIFHKEQCQMLIKRGINVSIYYPFDSINDDKVIKTFDDGIVVYRYNNHITNNFISKIIWLFAFLKNFKLIVDDFNPDIIHAHVGRVAGFYAMLLSFVYGIPYMVSEHAPNEQLGIDKKFVSLKNWFVYKLSKYNTCCSKYNFKVLHSKYKDIKFNVIYNLVNLKNINICNDVQYRINSVYNFLIVGSFYDKLIKGYQYLLPAIKKIKDENFRFALHIVGDGKYFNYYKTYSKELGVFDNCVFYGNCSKYKTINIINQMDFCVSTSISESAGIFCEESMMLGKPLLVTKSGGADSLCNNRTAYIIEKGSTEQIFLGLKYMFNNFIQFDKEYIKRYAFENFDCDNITDKYIKVYNAIINSDRC